MGIWMPIWVLIVEFIVVAVTGVFAVVETIYRRWWNAGAESVKEELDRERQVKAHAEAASKEAAKPAEQAKVPVPAPRIRLLPFQSGRGPSVRSSHHRQGPRTRSLHGLSRVSPCMWHRNEPTALARPGRQVHFSGSPTAAPSRPDFDRCPWPFYPLGPVDRRG
jgi:hypothetical protein